MKLAKLLHNPSAGDEEHSKKELISLIQSQGFECNYASTKESGWHEIENDTDFLIVAGGDGTVRKVAKKLMERKLIDKQYPIALLPMGTANNIATALGFPDKTENIIQTWNYNNIKKIDIGKISGLDNTFFLEGFGFGIFPRLMKEMKNRKGESVSPEEELRTALEVLAEVIDSYTAKFCALEIDGNDHSGEFLMVEVLNIPSIGPNLTLAPMADPGDGLFEAILIRDDQREEFKRHISNRIKGLEGPFMCTSITAKSIKLKWAGKLAHADDELIDVDEQELKIEILEGVLSFFVKP